MRIDSHQHFWNYHPVTHDWITDEMRAIRRDFTPADLQPLLASSHFDGSVAVQADQTDAETSFLLKLAGQNSFIRGVVGWVDFASPDIGDRLQALVQYKKLKGFRHITQGLPSGFLLRSDFLNGIGHLSAMGFTYDVLIYQNQMQEAAAFVRKFPDQKFVLDHLGKPLIKDAILEPWRKQIAELAAHENVYCKLSGMVTEARWNHWKREDFSPYLDAVLDCFGPNRVIFGSDWPVCLLASSYPEQLSIVEDYIDLLSASEKRGIMGENAVQFYNL